jgi:hypothetical protein
VSDDDRILRVEKGHAGPEELAALTAVLLAWAAAGGMEAEPDEDRPSAAPWRRLERRTYFGAPHSWQGAA